jgi:antitoxin component of RelBE/YafQ-DinJ toxin-antitoxin module
VVAKDTHTPPRSIRVDTPLWEAAKAAAAAEGKTVTDVVNAALRRYVKSRGVTPPPPRDGR